MSGKGIPLAFDFAQAERGVDRGGSTLRRTLAKAGVQFLIGQWRASDERKGQMSRTLGDPVQPAFAGVRLHLEVQ